MLWVKEHLSRYYKQLIITMAPKHLLAKPDTLLIDDKDENVEGFWDAGGKAILVPRPWNSNHKLSDVSVNMVSHSLEILLNDNT